MKRYMESHGILSEHDLMFYGPEGPMTLEAAQAKGYDVGLYLDGGPLVRRDLGAGFSLYELENRNQRDYERRLAAQMQNQNAVQRCRCRQMLNDPADYLWPPEPKVGGLEAGPAKHMGEPCALPRPGWRERVRQWRRR